MASSQNKPSHKPKLINLNYIVTCSSDYKRGLDWRLDLLTTCNTQLVIPLNHSAIVDFHILQITTAHAKSFECCVFTSRSLVTASNNEDSSASALTLLLSGEFPTTAVNSKPVPLWTPWHGPSRKHHFQQFLYYYTLTRRGNLFVSWSLPGNGSTRYSIFLKYLRLLAFPFTSNSEIFDYTKSLCSIF
jgi:hypothetical protein